MIIASFLSTCGLRALLPDFTNIARSYNIIMLSNDIQFSMSHLNRGVCYFDIPKRMPAVIRTSHYN